jgi:hypothetical protein
MNGLMQFHAKVVMYLETLRGTLEETLEAGPPEEVRQIASPELIQRAHQIMRESVDALAAAVEVLEHPGMMAAVAQIFAMIGEEKEEDPARRLTTRNVAQA